MKKELCSRRCRLMSAILVATLALSASVTDSFTLTVRAEEEVKKTVERVVSKPVISEIRNDYKGLVITWKEAIGAEGYRIFRRTKTSAPWEQIADVSKDVLSFIDMDAMKEGGIYTYMLQAYNGEKVSEQSAPKTATRFPVSKVKVKIYYAQKSARNMQKMINDFRTGSEAWLWNATNTKQERVQGLEKLAYDYNLEKIAMIRAAEIAIKFDHERPCGSDCFSAFSEAGYNYSYAGENIAYGYKTAKAAFEAFKEANNRYEGQGHRRNMLCTDYNVCAIGHAKVNGVHYWVQLFANTADDSDYTRTISATRQVSMYVASDDLSKYKKSLKSLGAKVLDFAPRQVTWVDAQADQRTIKLMYNKSIGAVGYEIYRSTNKKRGYKKIVTITKQLKLEFVDKKLKRKKKYYYYIVPYRIAHDEMIYGKKSEIKMVKTN